MTGNPHVRINLVVLYCRDLDASRAFYARFGMKFVAEQHGKGPEHFAAELASVVFELYPAKSESVVGGLRLGIQVETIDEICEKLRRAGVPMFGEPKDSPWGRRAVIQDPDGNKVELSEISR